MFDFTRYDGYLFDFDGLLVDTEKLHFEAYKQMCDFYDQHLDWDFNTFAYFAHANDTALKCALIEKFDLFKKMDWKELYAKKTFFYGEVLKTTAVDLMPGVIRLLLDLQQKDITRCVVTNSKKSQIEAICSLQPILKTIPYWITREDYTLPKPNSECYKLAIEKFSMKNPVGFEDSKKGMRALIDSGAKAVWVTQTPDDTFGDQIIRLNNLAEVYEHQQLLSP